MPPTPINTQERLLWLGGVLGVLLLILLGGLITRQLIQYGHFKRAEERQSLRRVILPAPRGVIYDRHGQVLASNRPRFSLIVYLGEMRAEFRKEQIRRVRLARAAGTSIDRASLQRSSIQAVLRAHIAPIERFIGTPLTLDLDKIERHLYQQPLMPYTLVDNLSLTQFARLTELLRVDAPIQLSVQSIRTYPQGDLATHALGFVSLRAPTPIDDSLRTFSYKGQVGMNGIEKTFDESLSGQAGYQLWLVDPAGYRYESTDSRPATPGAPLQLTIDLQLQQAIEKSFGSKIGAAAALDVNTGEVLALVSKPSYDPNDLIPSFSSSTDARIRTQNGWLNRAIQGLYPPGSTFKIITALAALEAGDMDIDETIGCPGYLEVGGRRFPCNRHSGHGTVNLPQSLEKSCNVFFYTLGLRTGPEAIMAQAQKYGFDRPSGIQLPGETGRMLLPTPQWKREKLFEPWYAGDTANVSIGQGDLLVTPLQMACFTASLARGETITPPTLIRTEAAPMLSHSPLTVAQARIRQGMIGAAQTGTAKLIRVDGLSIAAKTGTAQVKANGVNLTLAWTIAYAPADDPQVAIAVVVEGTSPDDEFAGGTTAAPIARSFFQAWLAQQQAQASQTPSPTLSTP